MVGVYIDNRSAVATASHFNKGPSFLSTRGPNRSAKMAFATKDSHNHPFLVPIPVLASPPGRNLFACSASSSNATTFVLFLIKYVHPGAVLVAQSNPKRDLTDEPLGVPIKSGLSL